MWNFIALLAGRLGGADVQAAIDLHRVGIYNLGIKLTGKAHGKLTLPGRRLATNYEDFLEAIVHLAAIRQSFSCGPSA
jgi:hypothetical protein